MQTMFGVALQFSNTGPGCLLLLQGNVTANIVLLVLFLVRDHSCNLYRAMWYKPSYVSVKVMFLSSIYSI